MNKFTVTSELSAERIADVVCTAVEGGIGYWASGFHPVSEVAPNDPADPCIWYGRKAFYEGAFEIRLTQLDEHEEGAGLEITLTPDSFQAGLTAMATGAPDALASIVAENYDASDADAFIQFAAFGELVYA